LDNHALNTPLKMCGPRIFPRPAPARLRPDDRLGESQQAIDLVTLTEELHRRGNWSGGRRALLVRAGRWHAARSNVEHYARIVKEKALLRNLIHATHNIQQRALEGEDGADMILDNASLPSSRWRKTA